MNAHVYEVSKRLGPISHDQLARALARFNLGEPSSVEPVPLGLFGQNVFVTSTKGELVFRGAPLTPWQFPTEQFFARLLHERTTAPAPWPYLIDESCEFFPWSYAIMPRMPGIQAADRELRQRLAKSDRLSMARAMARNLAAMQQLSAPACARFDPALGAARAVPLADERRWPFHGVFGEVSVPPAHREIIIARIRYLLERARRAGPRTTQPDADWVEQIVTERFAALGEPFGPCFVMEDYKEGNVVFRRGGGGWEVSGVFDLMGCYFGDGEADLSRTAAEYFDEAPEFAGEFIRTYLRLRTPRPGFSARFPLYMLLDRLIIWEYLVRQEPQTAGKLGGLRRWAERYTSIAKTLALDGTGFVSETKE